LNGDADTAADITQEVFLKLLENIQAVRMLGKFQNYLITIAVNICNNYFKKAKPIYTDLDALELTDDTDSSFDRIIQDENRLEVRRAINALPDYQKEVIILRFYHELKIREIAKITKASVPTVKSRLQQGLKKLQRYLTDFKGGESI
jgi:RNA polymerase sigma factor (sigma-70 family)